MMLYVRWKRYGFTHIIPEGGTKTVCGSSFAHYNGYRLPGWVSLTEKRQGLKPGDLDPKLLPPSEDDGQRPLCGTCAKHLK